MQVYSVKKDKREMSNLLCCSPGIWVLLLCVVSLVEDQNIDFGHLDEGIQQGMLKYVRCTHNHHVLTKITLPSLFIPEVWTHGTVEMAHVLVYVIPQNSHLLKH